MPFENQFIESYEGFDLLDTFHIVFMEAVLKVDIGPYSAGDTVMQISFNFETSVATIMDNDGDEVLFDIKITLEQKS